MSYTIRGRQYVPVYMRVNEFREKNPDWSIHTKVITNNETEIVVSANIIDEKGNVRATGHSRELVNDPSCLINKHSGIENCETSAIGRALANLGIGTEQMFASQDEINVAKLKEMKDLFDKKETESKTLPTANEMLIFFNKAGHISKNMYESAREYYTSYVVNSRMWKSTEDPSYLKLATSSHFNLLGLYYRSLEMKSSGSYMGNKLKVANDSEFDENEF